MWARSFSIDADTGDSTMVSYLTPTHQPSHPSDSDGCVDAAVSAVADPGAVSPLHKPNLLKCLDNWRPYLDEFRTAVVQLAEAA